MRLGSAWRATEFFFLKGLISADFADVGIAHIGNFSFETTAAAASTWFFRGVGAGRVALTGGGIYVFFFEFWHVSCVLICIRDPPARAVIAESLAGHAGGVNRVESISAALAARSAQSSDRIRKTLAFSYISGFFWARVK